MNGKLSDLYNILVFADEETLIKIEDMISTAENYSCRYISTIDDICQYFDDNIPHIVILADNPAKGFDPVEIYNTIKGELTKNIPVILITDSSGTDLREKLDEIRPFGVINGPVEKDILLYAIQNSLEKNYEILNMKEEKRYEELFDNLNCGMIVYKPINNGNDFVHLHFNRAAEKFENILKEKVLGKSINEIFPQAEITGLFKIMQEVLNDGNPRHHTISFYKKDGSLHWRDTYTYRLSSGNIVVKYDDVSDKIKTEKLINESKHIYSAVLGNTNDMIFILNRDGIVTYANRSVSNHYEIKEMDYANNAIHFSFFWCGDSIDKVMEAITYVIQKGQGTSIECICGINHFKLDITPIMNKDAVSSIICVASDITELKNEREKLKKALNASINLVAKILESKDPYTVGHQHNVAMFAKDIAKEMDLPEEKIDLIWLASLIHDIGKIEIPSEILSRPGKLSNKEFDLIKEHPVTAYKILLKEYPRPFPDIIYQHHERYDGSGYPLGLAGEEILIEARVIAVADVVEAIASNRPYRPGLGLEKAIEEITIYKNIYFDAKVVDAALILLKERNFGFGE